MIKLFSLIFAHSHCSLKWINFKFFSLSSSLSPCRLSIPYSGNAFYFISLRVWVKIHTSCSCVSLLLSSSLTSSVERGAILTCFLMLSIAFFQSFLPFRTVATKCLFLQALLAAAVRCVRIIRAFLVRSRGFFKNLDFFWVVLKKYSSFKSK